ncbi:MAG TPA: hypothetical protein VMV04_01095 [Thermodesulfobacteriota bacterium]|nr:hypothetical protein [Thermodesulfobacteriota bacterium]
MKNEDTAPLQTIARFSPFLQNGFNEEDICILAIHTKIFSSPVQDGFFRRLFSNSTRIFSPLWERAKKYVALYTIT